MISLCAHHFLVDEWMDGIRPPVASRPSSDLLMVVYVRVDASNPPCIYAKQMHTCLMSGAACAAQVHHVQGRCLVHHNPSPQLCAAQGGVWDDSRMTDTGHIGGECVSRDHLATRMRQHPNELQARAFTLYA